eukprot:jgi/Ulvmu1/4910/UM201_0002.1
MAFCKNARLDTAPKADLRVTPTYVRRDLARARRQCNAHDVRSRESPVHARPGSNHQGPGAHNRYSNIFFHPFQILYQVIDGGMADMVEPAAHPSAGGGAVAASSNSEGSATIVFCSKPQSLRIVLEADSDKQEFRSKLSDALFAIMAAEGIDAAMKWTSSDGSRGHVDVTIRAPHHQAFSALSDVSGDVHDTDGFTALQLPPNLNLWLVLDVLAATVNELYALSIKSKGLQRMCDVISVAHFLKNEHVESLMLGLLPSLKDALQAAGGTFLGQEGHALLLALRTVPDDVCASLMDALCVKTTLSMPPTMVNVWASRVHPLEMDITSEHINFDPQLCHLSGALRCTPRLKVLRLKLRTFNSSHGKAYRDTICQLTDQQASGVVRMTSACATCKKCKCDSRLAVLASSTPFLLDLEELEIRESSLDFGSAPHFFTLLEPLRSLKILRVTGPNPWLLHCGRLALCEAAATKQLEVLDLTGNGWNIFSASLLPLTRMQTLKQVLLHGSALEPSSALLPIHGMLEGYDHGHPQL